MDKNRKMQEERYEREDQITLITSWVLLIVTITVAIGVISTVIKDLMHYIG